MPSDAEDTLAVLKRAVRVLYDDMDAVLLSVDAADRLCLSVDCSDVFWWGCADCEEVTAGNVAVLERAHADYEGTKRATEFAVGTDLLFCCRARGMRPQGAFYKGLNADARGLLDACGPEREVGPGNPCSNGGA